MLISFSGEISKFTFLKLFLIGVVGLVLSPTLFTLLSISLDTLFRELLLDALTPFVVICIVSFVNLYFATLIFSAFVRRAHGLGKSKHGLSALYLVIVIAYLLPKPVVTMVAIPLVLDLLFVAKIVATPLLIFAFYKYYNAEELTSNNPSRAFIAPTDIIGTIPKSIDTKIRLIKIYIVFYWFLMLGGSFVVGIVTLLPLSSHGAPSLSSFIVNWIFGGFVLCILTIGIAVYKKINRFLMVTLVSITGIFTLLPLISLSSGNLFIVSWLSGGVVICVLTIGVAIHQTIKSIEKIRELRAVNSQNNVSSQAPGQV